MQRDGSWTTYKSDSPAATAHPIAPTDLEACHKVVDKPLKSGEAHDAQAEPDVRSKHCEHPSNINKAYDGWMACAKALRERESDTLATWAAEADSSLTFAALLSGVVTAFIVESYGSLRPDSGEGTIDVLRTISHQLGGTSAAPSPPETALFVPRVSDIMRNILLFASLICALISSAMSIFVKSWSREAGLDPDNRRNPRDLAYTHQYRHEALLAWRMQDIVTAIAMLLQLAVVLFMVGIVLFVWQLDPVLRGIVAGLIMFWFALTIVSAICAALFPACPFKSPFSRALLRAQQIHEPKDPLEVKEWKDIRKRQSALAPDALRYAFNTSWADQAVATLFPCLEELDSHVALKLVFELIRHRMGYIDQEGGVVGQLRLHPDSMEVQNLHALAKLLLALEQEMADTNANAGEKKTHPGKQNHHCEHDQKLLATVGNFVEARSKKQSHEEEETTH